MVDMEERMGAYRINKYSKGKVDNLSVRAQLISHLMEKERIHIRRRGFWPVSKPGVIQEWSVRSGRGYTCPA